MPIPSYGAAPLSTTFLLVRGLQVIAMIGIVGMTANFVSEMVAYGREPSKEVVGTLSVTCIATLYTLVSIAFYWAQANIGLFVMCGVDSLLLIAWIVVAVTVGKPLSFLHCPALGDSTQAQDAIQTYSMVQSMKTNLGVPGSQLDLRAWAGFTKANCYETKAIWGLSIALCILYTVSALLLPTLFFKNKKAGYVKDPA
ncbi:hypothetical protein P152DRAFT_454849 [Eremomyces bilateralis CBS 781.70]|uniref:MARVEL domain-containing protein n=1 Tax=Eremomyces bilateralis CBS 781.70 TaxID=1392243 RepID=A0A6G1GFC3_9PEZI|nr:uncharacterized protein P152DRAFT_454849 [Eremomyces bilateralis CBS 781.70]KAF1816611.1 hypothetical protein P152DRAFT_454849 [Eremomyces bilateralis CBS 781.70]